VVGSYQLSVFSSKARLECDFCKRPSDVVIFMLGPAFLRLRISTQCITAPLILRSVPSVCDQSWP
jgi:hypothetical protein